MTDGKITNFSSLNIGKVSSPADTIGIEVGTQDDGSAFNPDIKAGTQEVTTADITTANITTANIGSMALTSIYHAYGGFQDADETITINTKDTWEHITNGTNDLFTGLEADGMTLSGDVITLTNGGDYVGTLSITMSALNGKDYQIRLYNVTQTAQAGYEIGATTTGATNFTNVTLPIYIESVAGDQIRMEIRCTTDTTNVTLRSAVFELHYIHE